MPNGGLNTESVQGGAEDLVVVEAIDEKVVAAGLLGQNAIDDTLIQIGGAKSPDAAGKLDVMAVVYFAQVVEGARLFGVGQAVFAPIVLDGDVTLFNVDVGSAVLTHGAKFDEVNILVELVDGIEEIEVPNDVVDLGHDRVLAIDH